MIVQTVRVKRRGGGGGGGDGGRATWAATPRTDAGDERELSERRDVLITSIDVHLQ